jgi:hypothetical protein
MISIPYRNRLRADFACGKNGARCGTLRLRLGKALKSCPDTGGGVLVWNAGCCWQGAGLETRTTAGQESGVTREFPAMWMWLGGKNAPPGPESSRTMLGQLTARWRRLSDCNRKFARLRVIWITPIRWLFLRAGGDGEFPPRFQWVAQRMVCGGGVGETGPAPFVPASF